MSAQETPLEFSELLRRCMGEREFACGILESFLNTCDQQIEEICELNQSRSHDALAKVAHRFKGTAATVAAGPLTRTLTELERTAREDDSSNDLQQQILDKQISVARHEILRLHEFFSANLTKLS